MNNAEAIKGLLNVKMQMCEETPFTKAVDLAVMALERQIPKKPLIRYGNAVLGTLPNESFKIEECPCCKEYLDEETSYCQNCGQKIDWGENE